jgi:hypothetical protein
MITPLYKRLKNRGTTLYVLPGAIEDNSAEKQNPNVKMTFSKFVLLNLPTKNVIGDKKVFDFNGSLVTNTSNNGAWSFADELVGSLRNYVANQESVIRNSKAGSKNYLYNPNEARTVTERVFWKWLKKLNVLELEPANTFEYDVTKDKFNPVLPNNTYLPEILWRERRSVELTPKEVSAADNKITVKFRTSVNYKVNDTILVWSDNISNPLNVKTAKVTKVFTSANVTGEQQSINDTVEFENSDVFTWFTTTAPTADSIRIKLDYNRCIQYVGEISASNNVQTPNSSYSEIYAHIPAQSGLIPYVLFRTLADSNYKPNAKYPLIPSEIKQVINGAETSNSPIVAKPTDYPGNYNAHFDTETNQYVTSTGDAQKKYGDYFGIASNVEFPITDNTDFRSKINYPQVDGANIDGLSLDFDITDYKVAQSTDVPCSSFNEFTAATLNGIAPEDFEFNAVLWYYDFIDMTNGEAQVSTNLYGIEFLDNPNNDKLETKIPTSKKLVANGTQDGTAYTLSVNLEYTVDSESAPMSFDPDRVYSLYGFDMFNEVMARLARVAEMYQTTLPQLTNIKQDIMNMKGLLYTQQGINELKLQIKNMENLLSLYSTLQIGESSSIKPFLDTTVNPPMIRLESIDKTFGDILTINAKDLFTDKKVIENNVEITKRLSKAYDMSVGNGKDIMAYVVNNDDSASTYSEEPSDLSINIDRDLHPLQTITFNVEPGNVSTNDNYLSVNINYNDGNKVYSLPIVKKLPMPVSLMSDNTNEPANDVVDNINIQPSNIYISKIDEEKELILDFDTNVNFLKEGSRIRLNNFYYKLDSNKVYDLSGQYKLNKDAGAISFLPSTIISAYIKEPGFDYSTSGNFDMEITIDENGNYVATQFSDGMTLKENAALVTLFTDEAGSLSNVVVKTGGYGFKPSANEINISLINTNNTGTIKLQVKPITRIKLDISKPSEALTKVITKYDSLFLDKPSGFMMSMFDINYEEDMLVSVPYIDFNKGYIVKVTHTGKKTDVFSAEISAGIESNDSTILEQATAILKSRYKIQIEKV